MPPLTFARPAPLEPTLRPNTRKGFNRLLKAIREQAPATVVAWASVARGAGASESSGERQRRQ